MAETKRKLNVAHRLEWLRFRWWHTLVIHLFWPGMLAGTLYVLLFFFLNSGPFEALVEAQLDAAMMGRFQIDDLEVGPWLDQVDVRGLRILEPDGTPVLSAERATVQVSPWDLLQLLTRDQLALRDVVIEGADVLLDFRDSGPFNLLRALEPRQTSGEPSSLTFSIDDVSIHRSRVHLAFELFDLDLEQVTITGFNLSVGPDLKMSTVPAALGPYGLTIGRGTASFQPALFNYPLAEHGSPDVGLVTEGGGIVGHVAVQQQHTVAALQATLARVGIGAAFPTRAPPRRGNLVVPVRDVRIDDFWWRGMTFGFTRLTGGVSRGHVVLRQPWMNLVPSADDVASAAKTLGHTPSQTPLDETILFRAILDLRLPADDPAIAYFIGPLIQSSDPIDLSVKLSGDLGRAEGTVSAVAQQLRVADRGLTDLAVEGTLRGQRFDLHEATANVLGGAVRVFGHYLILDGDFALEVELGEQDPDSGNARVRGVELAQLLPPLVQGFAPGELTGHLRLARAGYALTASLVEPLRLELLQPLPWGGATTLVAVQTSSPGEPKAPLVSWEHRTLRTHAGLQLDAGSDHLALRGGLALDLDTLAFVGLDVTASLGNIARYLEPFGISGLATRDVTLTAVASGPLRNPALTASLEVRGGRWGELEVDSLDLDATVEPRRGLPRIGAQLRLVDARGFGYQIDEARVRARLDTGKVELDELYVQTPWGRLEVTGWVDPFANSLTALRSAIRMDLKLTASRVPLGEIPTLAALGISGKVDLLEARLRGTHLDPRVEGKVIAHDVKGFGEHVLRLESGFAYAGDQVAVNDLRVTLPRAVGRPTPTEPQVRVERAAYNLTTNAIELVAAVDNLALSDLATLRAATTGVDAEITLLLDAAGDLDLVTGGRVEQPARAHGRVELADVAIGERRLGKLELAFETRDDELTVSGTVLEHFAVTGGARLAPPFDAHGRLEFVALDWLAAFPEVATAVNGAPEAHLDVSRVAARAVPISHLRTTGALAASYTAERGLAAAFELDDLAITLFGEPLRNEGPMSIAYTDADQTIAIQRLQLEHSGAGLMIWGTLGLDGAVDLEVNGEVNARMAQAAAGIVDKASGSLAAAITLNGNALRDGAFDPRGLDLGGFVAVREPIRLQLRGLTDPVILDTGVIHIASAEECGGSACYRIPPDRALRGQLLGGAYTVEGSVWRDAMIPDSAELYVTARDLSYRLRQELTLTFDVPELTLYADDFARPETYGVTGEVLVTEGRYAQAYDLQGELLQQRVVGKVLKRQKVQRYEQPIWKKIPLLAKLNLDVRILSEAGVRVLIRGSGAEANVDLAFDLRLEGTLKEPRPTGTVDLRDGRLVFRSNEFDLRPGGQLTFTGDLDPRLEVSAQAEISAMHSFSSAVIGGTTRDRRRINTAELASGSQSYLVTIAVSGRISNYDVLLESQPAETQASIAMLILTGKTLAQLSENRDESPALDIAFETLLAPLFEAQVDEVLGADEFKFMVSEGAAQFVYIQQVNRALRIAAGVSIRGAEGNEQVVSGEYKYSDRLAIEVTGQNTIEEAGKAPVPRVGARLRWRIPLD